MSKSSMSCLLFLTLLGTLTWKSVGISSQQPLTSKFKALKFNEGFNTLWGTDHQNLSEDGMSVTLKMDRYSGSGFKSKEGYMYGFFSAAMKLPPGYTAGIISTFYLSNSEVYPGKHDELDFEFLGTIPGEPYTLQTNMFGNGSGDGNSTIGREQQFHLWFDPTQDFHNYSFLWSPHHIVFMVDDVVIRQDSKMKGLGGRYPSKPMWIYATIWDGSDWATDGGRYRANYSYEPFYCSYKNLIIAGCPADSFQPQEEKHKGDCPLVEMSHHGWSLSHAQKHDLRRVRSSYMKYDYCNDTSRYPYGLPECPHIPSL